jgi:hypothetical protein
MKKDNQSLENEKSNRAKDETNSGVLNVDITELEMISSTIQPGGDPNISPTAGKPLI